MWPMWIFLFSLQLDNTNSIHFETMLSNWRVECIRNFYTVIQMKSLGILYKDDTNTLLSDILTIVAEKGISSALLQFSDQDFSNVTRSIIKWKSIGIDHVFFLQILDSEILQMWLKVLSEICNDTWWLFYAEDKMKKQFENILSTSDCFTNRWIVFSENCLLSQCNELNKEQYSNILQNSSSIYYSENVKEPTKYLQETTKKVIKLAVNESPPYLTVYNINDTWKLGKGSEAELLQTIADKFGFEYKISVSPDGEWGRKRSGNWTGLIGMLTRGEADIAAGCVTMTFPRHGVSAFSYPYDVQKSVIITRIPKVKPKTYAVLSPFTVDVWMMILFISLSFLFFFYSTGMLYGIIYSQKPYKLGRIFMFLIGSACSEGGWLTFAVKGPVTFLLLTLWLLFVLIMQASYCGTLMSVLSFPSREPAIDTLYDLAKSVKHKGYKCGCMKGTINCDIMLDLNGDLKIIASSLNSDSQNFVRSVEAGLEKVLKDKYAFIAQEIGSIYRGKLMPEPNFYISNDVLDIELFSLAVRNELPYLKDIDNMILRLTEAGLIAKWRDDIISLNNMMFARRNTEVTAINPLSLTELTGAIYMFSYGLVLSLIAFIFENIDGRCFNKEY